VLGGLMILHLWLLINLQFTVWPEMMSYPYFYNGGFRLYTDFIYPYTPLLTWVLAGLYRLFGYKALVAQTLTWGLILVTDWLVYLIVKRLVKKDEVALISVLIYVLVQPALEGNMIWFDVVVVTPILAGFYFLVGKKYWRAGLALGVACLVKQTAGLFLITSVGYVMLRERNWRSAWQLLIGPMALGLALLGYVWANDSLREFLNWTLVYPLTEWGKYPGYVEMGLTEKEMVMMAFLLAPWVLVVRKRAENWGLLTLFLAVALVVMYPRFSYLHLQTALAFLMIGYGLIVAWVRGGQRGLWVGFWLFVFLCIIRQDIVRRWGGEVRFMTSDDWQKAQVIEEKIPEGERVYLLGLQSGFYPMSGRISAMPWTDNFGWYLETPGVQEGILERWEEGKLDYVIWREPDESESELGKYQPELITNWIYENYMRQEEVWEGTYLWVRKS
jgi:hypothetical protein